MEKWSIEIDKEYLKFSSAHFLIFPDGSAERLHGHNYRVWVMVRGDLCEHGLVLDFQKVKPVIREIVEGLDERWLLPGEHPKLKIDKRKDGVLEVRYQDRFYAAPEEDVLVLPINNTSVENLAAWVGRTLKTKLETAFPGVTLHALQLAVEETPGQRGVYRFEGDAPEKS